MFEGLLIESAATNVRLTFEAGKGIGPVGAFTDFEPFPSGQVPTVHTIWFNVLVGDIGQIVERVPPGGCSLDGQRQGIPCTRSPVLELQDLGGNVVSATDKLVSVSFACIKIVFPGMPALPQYHRNHMHASPCTSGKMWADA